MRPRRTERDRRFVANGSNLSATYGHAECKRGHSVIRHIAALALLAVMASRTCRAEHRNQAGEREGPISELGVCAPIAPTLSSWKGISMLSSPLQPVRRVVHALVAH